MGALAWANSPASPAYFSALRFPLGISAGGFTLEKGLLLWINDGLMAVFFFLVGLEIKRELVGGELSAPREAVLPIAGALGGLAVPGLVYALLNAGGPGADGWAIPMATDIAFALGVLALVGSRAPLALKVFLTAVAILDDLAAVLIIGIFHTARLDVTALLWAGGLFAALLLVNRVARRSPWPYLILGVALWFAVLQSGVHATLAGVLAALAVPHDPAGAAPVEDDRARSPDEEVRKPTLTERLEHGLQPWVAFGILPVFALANAGVALPSELGAAVLDPVGTGVFLGLAVGKPAGVLLAVWTAVRLGLADRPEGVTWRHLHGTAWLCGIGFTMSLFISSLALDTAALLDTSKLAILAASLVAGLVGWSLLRGAPEAPEPVDSAARP